MAIYSKLSNVRKLTNSSLNAIIDVSNLNFTDISNAMLEFLNNISYDESTNSIDKVYELNTKYLNVSNEFTVTLNGVPTWTIDSQGRAEGNSFLVEVAESKRDRHTDFPNWPDEGIPGEVIYTGVQNQKPQFGEDLIGYLDGRGWVSLTQGGGANVNGSYTTIVDFTAGVPVVISHGLKTENIHVQLIDTNTDELIYGEIDMYEEDTVNVTLTANLTDIKIVILSAGGTSSSGDSCWTCVGSPGFDIQMKVPGAVLPWGDDIDDLGEPSLRWKDIYLGSTLDFLTTLDIDNDGNTIIKIGAAGAEFESDFSGTYNNRSIVDKEYVDNSIVDRGLTYLILAGDITDGEAVTKINQDTGENTQFVWIQNTDALTTATIPDVQDAVEVKINNNQTLLTVNVPDLEKNWIEGEIFGNPLLTSISFPLLDKIAGTMDINGNPLLTSIDFSSLIELNSIDITGNGINAATMNFDSLTNAEYFIRFRDNSITAWNFPELLTIGNPTVFNDSLEGIKIYQENSLTDVLFPKLVSNHGSHHFNSNPLLTNIYQPELIEIAGRYGMLIEDCHSLVNLDFPKLERVYDGELYINSNDLLESVSLPLLEEVDSEIEFIFCPSLLTVELPSFTTVIQPLPNTYYFKVLYNDVLTKIECNSIVDLNSGLQIVGNPLLTDINFPLLETVGYQLLIGLPGGPPQSSLINIEFPKLNTSHTIQIRSMDNLESISFPELTTMIDQDSGYYQRLQIDDLSSIADISFPLLKDSGDFSIFSCDFINFSPAGFIDFPSLESINGTLQIQDNSVSFESIILANVETITKSIFINGNDGLTSLDLSSLSTVGNTIELSVNIYIIDNPSLVDLEFPSLVSIESSSLSPLNRNLYLYDNNLSTTTLDNLFIYFAALSPHITHITCRVDGNQGVSGSSLAARNDLITLANWTIQT